MGKHDSGSARRSRRCGCAGLQDLYGRCRPDELTVLAFPRNQSGDQESAECPDIEAFLGRGPHRLSDVHQCVTISQEPS